MAYRRFILEAWRAPLAYALLLTTVLAAPAAAQTTSVLANFEIGPKNPVGALVQLQDGVFYGVSHDGGVFSQGSIFILYRSGGGSWGVYTLHSFNGVNGARPIHGLLLASDGNFYGTTTQGGPLNGGTAFRITPFGVFTTLHAFPIVLGTGDRPASPLVQSADGFLWGTTCPNSPPGQTSTSVFRMTLAGSFTTIYRSPNFGNCLRSVVPADDGSLFGLSEQVVSFPGTSTFRLTRAGQLTTMSSFLGVPATPIFRGSGGIFYGLLNSGSTSGGMPGNGGRVFGFHADGSFALNAVIEIGNPETIVEVSPGVLYGTAREYLSGPDRQFRVQPDGQISVVKEWPLDDSHDLLGGPRTGLIKGADGLLYGLSSREGSANFGAAFSVDLSGNAVGLSAFTPGPLMPLGPLVESAGASYGTSCAGGTRDRGTVFRSSAGAVTITYSFDGASGACPTMLLKGPDGDFYGNTYTGAIFRLTHAGAISVLHQLDPAPVTRQFPDAITVDGAGNLWGNWQDGAGTFVYRVTPAGTFTRFDAPEDAGVMGPGVSVGPGANLFGATHIGPGTFGSSRLFQMTPTGSFAPLFTFPSREFLLGRLLPASDDLLYGTVAAFHRNSGGHVFRATLDGQGTALHVFTLEEGLNSFGQLVELPGGELAGVTFGTRGWVFGTDYNFGIAFAVSKTGVFRTLHRFTWLNGANPYAGLLVGSDGGLYGTTTAGGLKGGGVVFRIQP